MKKLELLAKKFLLRFLIIVGRTKKETSKIGLNKDSKVLFIRLNKIGDALVTTPVLYEIKKQTGCGVVVLADPKNYFVFNNKKLSDKIWVYEKGFFPLMQLIRKINKEEFDCIIDLHDDVSFTVSLIVAYSSAKSKASLRKASKKLFTHTIEKLDAKTTHVMERGMKLLELFNIESSEEITVKYFPDSQFETKVKHFVESHYKNSKFLVGINISAGSDARFWGVNNYRKLTSFLSNNGVDYVVLSSTKDLQYAFGICSDKAKVFYSPSFDEFSLMISQLDMLFSPDTATIHIASIYKVPVFGLYVQYETDDVIWYPYGTNYEVVVTREPNLNNISYEGVIEKFEPFLNKYLLNAE